MLHLQERLGGGSYVLESCPPGLIMAAEKGTKDQTTVRCNPVWEESKMGLWRKICPRI